MGSGKLCTSLLLRDLAHQRYKCQVSANLVEPGENALVLNAGYFGDSFADWYAYGSTSRVPLVVLNHVLGH